VQFTPPRSPASIHFGTSVTDALPGTANVWLIVSDIVAARAELAEMGVDVPP
jgi:hypothetical protein